MVESTDPVVTVTFGEIVADPGRRIRISLWFNTKDEQGYVESAEMSIVLDDEDYKLSELREKAVQRGREVLSRLVSRRLDLTPRLLSEE